MGPGFALQNLAHRAVMANMLHRPCTAWALKEKLLSLIPVLRELQAGAALGCVTGPSPCCGEVTGTKASLPQCSAKLVLI